jgi:hypothetical protein
MKGSEGSNKERNCRKVYLMECMYDDKRRDIESTVLHQSTSTLLHKHHIYDVDKDMVHNQSNTKEIKRKKERKEIKK